MNQTLNHWTSQPEATGSDAGLHQISSSKASAAHGAAYHPECSDAHHHKPTKALIGLGLLMVLSFLLYEFNGKSPDGHLSATPPAQHQSFAYNR